MSMQNPVNIDSQLRFLSYLVEKGGPDVDEFYDLDAWIAEIVEQQRAGRLTSVDLDRLRTVMGEAISPETMQGFAFQKPHGYAGDYEIIDRIYTGYVSGKSHLSKWDVYSQQHACAQAVRNRVDYFCLQLNRQQLRKEIGFGQILNLASGPGRDMRTFFERNPNTRLHFDCIEQDQNAVNHAMELCADYLPNIRFHVKNVLRFKPTRKYDLIWSAGLFDYFEDKVFVHMLERLGAIVEDGGEIIIGNFSITNSSRHYMEFFDWNLYHRSPLRLKTLAVQAGFSSDQMRIEKERTGVNLFLHIRPNGFSS